MAFNLSHAVIHSFEKETNSGFVDPTKIVKKDLFDVTIQGVLSLVSSIHFLLGKPGNNVVWGQFGNSDRKENFPDSVSALLQKTTAAAFESLTHVALNELVYQAKQESFATGGHVLFAQYEVDKIPFALVAVIKQRDGLRLNANYIPIETKDIDMSKVQQAARINLARLAEFLNPEMLDDEVDAPIDDDKGFEKEKTYLCFISRGKGSEASGYFIKALGCEKGVASARATRNAIDMVEKYFKKNDGLKVFRVQAREKVIRYLQQKIQDGSHATLDGVYSAAVAGIPAERADLTVLAEGLKEFLNDEDNQVPDEFVVNSVALNQKIRIKGESGPHWTLFFEKGALGTDENSKVCYLKDEGKIILSAPSEKLCRAIEKALAEDKVE